MISKTSSPPHGVVAAAVFSIFVRRAVSVSTGIGRLHESTKGALSLMLGFCPMVSRTEQVPSEDLADNGAAVQLDRSFHLAAQPARLVPGQIVGQGRYVLAEKLCDVMENSPKKNAPLQFLPPPSHSLLQIGTPVDGDPESILRQMVPYELLTRAIAQDLPTMPMASAFPDFLPTVHDFSLAFVRGDPHFQEDWRFRFGERLGRGAFGEAWRAVSLDGSLREVVLKRLFVEKGEHVRRSGEREIYFGTVLQHRPHIARYIESFEQEVTAEEPNKKGNKLRELWLVFYNEGFSLTQHMFMVRPNSPVVEVSEFWNLIKRQPPLGDQVFKNIAYQLLHAIAVVHELNVTHRDVKGPNVFFTDTWPPVLRLGDWGSATISPPTDEVLELYGERGPTEQDESEGYQPPEVLFSQELLQRVGISKANSWRHLSYDLWSSGVLLLELILGTRDVFKANERQWTRTQRELRRRAPGASIEEAKMLQAFMDLCLVPEGVKRGTPISWFFADGADDNTSPLEAVHSSSNSEGGPWCTDDEFAAVLRERDVEGVGLPSPEGRNLLSQLLAWSPRDRIDARSALAHSWFDDGATLPPLRGLRRKSKSEARSHDHTLENISEEDQEPSTAPEEAYGDIAQCKDDLAGKMQEVSEGPLSVSCPQLQVHAAARSNIGRRYYMEDNHVMVNLSSSCSPQPVLPDAEVAFLGIFDGHGGAEVAQRLRRTMHHHLVAEPEFPANMTTAIANAFSAFDEVLRGQAAGEHRLDLPGEEAGSTALVAVFSDCKLYLANLGDCRAVLARRGNEEDLEEVWPLGALVEVREAKNSELRGQRGVIVQVRSTTKRMYVVQMLRDGALKPLPQKVLRLLSELRAVRITEDHKPNTDRERRRIEALGGKVDEPKSPGGPWRVVGLATSRSFGSFSSRPFVGALPDLTLLNLDRGRDVFVVLASDGVWDVLEDQLAVDLIWDLVSSVRDSRFSPSAMLADAAELIVQTALERGSMDNLTCLVVLLQWSD